MALQKDCYYEPFNQTFTDAYWRINVNTGIIGGKNNIDYNIEAFVDETHANKKNSQSIVSMNYSFKPDITNNALNFIAQAYNDAKTLDLFDGAINV